MSFISANGDTFSQINLPDNQSLCLVAETYVDTFPVVYKFGDKEFVSSFIHEVNLVLPH